MQTGNDLFYSRLPVNEISLSDLLTEDHLFYTTPPDWHIVITDVRNSTAEKEILYGLFVSRESVISCYVRNLNEGHIHFVDGAEGGYTRAAGVLKKKILHEG